MVYAQIKIFIRKCNVKKFSGTLKYKWQLILGQKFQVFVYCFVFLHFHPVVHWNRIGDNFFSCQLIWGLTFWPGLNISFVSQNLREINVSFSRTDSGLCIYHLLVWSNFNILHNSQWITIPTQSCLITYIYIFIYLFLAFSFTLYTSLSHFHRIHLSAMFILSLWSFSFIVFIFFLLFFYYPWLECLPMTRETGFESQVESYQRLKKWYLMPPCLAFSTIRWGSRVNWSNPGNGVAPSPTHWCCNYWKGSLRVALN